MDKDCKFEKVLICTECDVLINLSTSFRAENPGENEELTKRKDFKEKRSVLPG